MNEHREQAIRDVAEATKWSSDDVKLFISQAGTESDDGSDRAFAYAASQRELVLQLRGVLNEAIDWLEYSTPEESQALGMQRKFVKGLRELLATPEREKTT